MPVTAAEPVAAVNDVIVRGAGHGIPVRIPVPDHARPLPTLVWAHGGGFIVGGLDTEDDTARDLAKAGGASSSPSTTGWHPSIPSPLPSGTSTTRRGGSSGTSTRTAATLTDWPWEDSAGGTLAASTALIAQADGDPEIDHQLLVYPALNHTGHVESYDESADSFLGADVMEWFDECDLPHPRCGYDPMAYPPKPETSPGSQP